MNVRIRNAQLEDIESLIALLGQLFSIEEDFEVNPEKQNSGLGIMIGGSTKHHCIKVAEVDGTIVGMCTIQTLVSTAEGGMVGIVEDMIVDADYRGKGIGRQLMEHIKDWATVHQLRRLQLLADRTNFHALEFYDHLGWKPTRLTCLRYKKGMASL